MIKSSVQVHTYYDTKGLSTFRREVNVYFYPSVTSISINKHIIEVPLGNNYVFCDYNAKYYYPFERPYLSKFKRGAFGEIV